MQILKVLKTDSLAPLSTKGYTSELLQNSGMVFLQSEPQFRTISIYNPKTMHNERLFLPFPYIINIVRFFIDKKYFYYPGLHGYGLHIFLANKPITSSDSMVCPPPQDYSNRGLVCTSHEYDRKRYNSLFELVNETINNYWGISHSLISGYGCIKLEDWKNMTLDEIIKVNSPFEDQKLSDFLGFYFKYNNSKLTFQDPVPFNKKNLLKLFKKS